MDLLSKFKPNRREQLFCIRPKDKAERHKFWVFRCQQGESTLFYIAIIHATIFLLDLVVTFPSNWNEAMIKLIQLLRTLVYVAIWLASIRFPSKYTYSLPLLVMVTNTLILCYLYLSLVNQEEQTQENIARNFTFSSLAQMRSVLILGCFVAPSFGNLFAIIVADVVARVLHYEFVWKHLIDFET